MARRRLDLRLAAALVAEENLTMSDVARRLGVAKPTLYRLAGSRDELVRLCVETEAERLMGHLYHHAGGAVGVVRAVAAFAADSPGGFALLFARRGPETAVALRRVESSLAGLDGGGAKGQLVAAARLGGAAAAVARARADGAVLDAEALAAAW